MEANLDEHLRLTQTVAAAGARVVVFPELSLTGYELGLADARAFSEHDPHLSPLIEAATSCSTTLIVGAPVRIGLRLHIGAFIVYPDRTTALYTKHHLGAFSASASCDGTVPPAEATVFQPGDRNPLLRSGGEIAAVAVCADIGRSSHPRQAADRGARTYLASMFVIPSEFEGESARLPAGEDAKRAVTRMAGLPLLVATKLPDPERGPTLVVWRQPASAEHHAATDNEGFCLVHQRTYQLYAPYLRDYRLDSALADVFGGRPASCCKVRFGEDNDRGEAWSVQLESHMLRWQDSWLTFNFLDLQEGWGRAARADFTTLERSLEFFSV